MTSTVRGRGGSSRRTATQQAYAPPDTRKKREKRADSNPDPPRDARVPQRMRHRRARRQESGDASPPQEVGGGEALLTEDPYNLSSLFGGFSQASLGDRLPVRDGLSNMSPVSPRHCPVLALPLSDGRIVRVAIRHEPEKTNHRNRESDTEPDGTHGRDPVEHPNTPLLAVSTQGRRFARMLRSQRATHRPAETSRRSPHSPTQIHPSTSVRELQCARRRRARPEQHHGSTSRQFITFVRCDRPIAGRRLVNSTRYAKLGKPPVGERKVHQDGDHAPQRQQQRFSGNHLQDRNEC